MKIRPYSPCDENAVIQLWWDAWHSSSGYKHPQPIARWRSRWQTLVLSHRIVVTEHAGEVVGFAAVNLSESVLSQIFVAPHWQRQGIGTLLMRWARKQCPTGFSLETAVDNHLSRAFYLAQGMSETSHGINDFNGRPTVGFEQGETQVYLSIYEFFDALGT